MIVKFYLVLISDMTGTFFSRGSANSRLAVPESASIMLGDDITRNLDL